MRSRWWIPALWLVVMLGGVWFSFTRVSIHNDLGDLLPQGSTWAQRLLLTQVRTGLSGRLILLALEGESPDELARISKLFGESLRADHRLGFVGNGMQTWSKEEQALLSKFRYLLSPTLTAETFSEASLRQALGLRLDDLRSPLAPIVKASIPADPTGEVFGILQSWAGWEAPEKYRGVWMSADRTMALLVVETRASGFDADAQTSIHQLIRTSFHELTRGTTGPIRLLMSGPSVFALEIQQTIEDEAWWLSVVAATLVLLFLLLSYRSIRLVLLTLIPISSGIVVGMIAVNGWFGFVHGITLGFGITLLGVVDDYPIHLFSHLTPGSSAPAVMRGIWPTMRMGIGTTAIGFSALLFAGYPALAQLGLLALVGLLTAALVTRWVLPFCIGDGFVPREVRPGLLTGGRLLAKGRGLVPVALCVAAVALIWSDTPIWEQDLGNLTPLPIEQKSLDQRLRQGAGAPDLRDVLLVEDSTDEGLLQKVESVTQKLEAFRVAGTLAGYESVTRYLPSRRRQQERQLALPDSTTLRKNLAAAQKGLPFAPGLFAPFVTDVEAARSQQPIDHEVLASTMLRMKLDSLMFLSHDRWVAVVPLRGVADRQAFAATVVAWGDPAVGYMDLKEESNRLMMAYRDRTLQLLGWGTVVIALALLVGLRSVTLLWRVLAPIACSIVVVAAVLRSAGEPLSLFHVATLLLVVGLGLDYALFLNRSEGTEAEQVRTNFGLLVCSTTTILVFGVLACSKIPVLHAIGLTAACGSFFCLLFASLMARREAPIV